MGFFFKLTKSGVLDLALAQTIFGGYIVLTKYLLTQFPIALLLGFRFTLGAVLLYGMVKLQGKKLLRVDGQPLQRKDWVLLSLQGLCAGALFNGLMMAGLHYTTAATAGIINSTAPALIALFSLLLLRERLSFSKITGIGIAVVGLIVLSWGESKGAVAARGTQMDHLLGDFLVLMAVIPEALFTILAKWFGGVLEPMMMAFVVGVFNAVLFAPITVWSLLHYGWPHVDMGHWLGYLMHGFMSSVCFYFFWFRGLKSVQASTAALFTSIMPVAAMCFAVLFLHEHIRVSGVVGMMLVMISIIVGAEVFGRSTLAGEC